MSRKELQVPKFSGPHRELVACIWAKLIFRGQLLQGEIPEHSVEKLVKMALGEWSEELEENIRLEKPSDFIEGEFRILPDEEEGGSF